MALSKLPLLELAHLQHIWTDFPLQFSDVHRAALLSDTLFSVFGISAQALIHHMYWTHGWL